jgi:hypothetical protein
MRDGMLSRLVAAWRDEEPDPQAEWWQQVERERMLDRWRTTILVVAALIVLVLAWGGLAVGRLAAVPVVWAQAEAADRAAPKGTPPPLPTAPFYTPRNPVPLPSRSPVAVRGEPPWYGWRVEHDGLPFQMSLPGPANWSCDLISAPGGQAESYEWTCEAGDYMRRFEVRVLLAPCGGGCDAHERDSLRPGFMPSALTEFDRTTWYAEGSAPPSVFGGENHSLAIEHVWAAPPGVMRAGSPAETLYVAVVAIAPQAERAVAYHAINILRTGM